jgi:hypothetical protein
MAMYIASPRSDNQIPSLLHFGVYFGVILVGYSRFYLGYKMAACLPDKQGEEDSTGAEILGEAEKGE